MNAALFAVVLLPLALGPQTLQSRWTTHSTGKTIVPRAQRRLDMPLSDQAGMRGWRKVSAVWDDFDGATLDLSKWKTGINTWDGPQPCFYSPANVAVQDGNLVMTLRYEDPPPRLKAEGYHTYSGAGLTSKVRCLYGYYEMRAKAGKSHGSSAFWFHSNDPDWWTEIDVFEITGTNPQLNMEVFVGPHVFHTPTEKEHFKVGSSYRHSRPPSDEFHVYAVDWQKDTMRFYFDGELVFEGPNTHWHQPIYMNIDHDILKGWFGLPTSDELPSRFLVDYVHAWQRG